MDTGLVYLLNQAGLALMQAESAVADRDAIIAQLRARIDELTEPKE